MPSSCATTLAFLSFLAAAEPIAYRFYAELLWVSGAFSDAGRVWCFHSFLSFYVSTHLRKDHTVAVFLNLQLGRPPLDLDDLVAH